MIRLYKIFCSYIYELKFSKIKVYVIKNHNKLKFKIGPIFKNKLKSKSDLIFRNKGSIYKTCTNKLNNENTSKYNI